MWHRRARWFEAGVAKRELLIANNFFPVNFDGSADPIAADLIELTRSLLLLGSCQAQALPEGSQGIVPLSGEGQRLILTEWKESVRSRQPPLPENVLALIEAGASKASEELELLRD